MTPAAHFAYGRFCQLIARIDEALGDATLVDIEAALCEDDRSVSILLRGRGTEWIAAGATMKKQMRPHVFRAEIREKLEAFIVAELSLHRTGYGGFPTRILTDAELELFE